MQAKWLTTISVILLNSSLWCAAQTVTNVSTDRLVWGCPVKDYDNVQAKIQTNLEDKKALPKDKAIKKKDTVPMDSVMMFRSVAKTNDLWYVWINWKQYMNLEQCPTCHRQLLWAYAVCPNDQTPRPATDWSDTRLQAIRDDVNKKDFFLYRLTNGVNVIQYLLDQKAIEPKP